MKIKTKVSIIKVIFVLLIFSSFLFPYFTSSVSGLNENFQLTCFCSAVCVIYLYLKKELKRDKFSFFFEIVSVLFLIVGFYYNYRYNLSVAWLVVNQFIAFYFFSTLYRRNIVSSKCFLQLKNTMTNIFFMSNILSIFYRMIGGEAIRFYDTVFRFRKQGLFSDSRLTFVYTHKSVYGLLLLMVLIILIMDVNITYRIIKIITAVITLLLVNSAVALICTIILFMYFFLKKYWKKMNFYSRIVFSFIAMAITFSMFAIVFNVVGMYRNIDNLGGRIAIWSYAISYLTKNNIGIGDAFGSQNYASSQLTFSFNNFHNVFLNEMLQISTLVGVLYIILFIMIYCKIIRESENKLETLLLLSVLLIPPMFDHAISTASSPIYFLLMLFIFFAKPKKAKVN